MPRLLCLDVEKKEVREVECNDLEDYYRELNCSAFDIARRRIGGMPYDIYCDDEGLLKDHPIVSAANANGEPMLCGNLIFSNTDGAGNTVSLSDEDINHIERHIWDAKTRGGRKLMVVICEY